MLVEPSTDSANAHAQATSHSGSSSIPNDMECKPAITDDPVCLIQVAQEIIFYFHWRCQGPLAQPDETHCGRLSILVDQIKLRLPDCPLACPSHSPADRSPGDLSQGSVFNCEPSSQDEFYNLLVEALSEISHDYQRGYTIQQAENEGYVDQAKSPSPQGRQWLLAYRLSDHSFLVYGIRGSLVSSLTTRLGVALQLKHP